MWIMAGMGAVACVFVFGLGLGGPGCVDGCGGDYWIHAGVAYDAAGFQETWLLVPIRCCALAN
jgi:hypothetical protein